MAAPSSSRPPHRRSRWYSVHRWLGVGLGLWFVAVGLTGALLVWRDDLDAALNPAWFHARAAGAALPIDRVVEIAHAEHGLVRIERVRLPARPGEVYRLQARASPSRVESGRLEAFVDPADGALLGLRSLEPRSLARPHVMRTLYDFHRNILLSEPGSNIVGVAGALLLTSAISGLVVAWPRSRERWRRLVSVSWRANGTRVSLDLHRSCGALIAIVLLLSTVTGETLVYLNYVRDLVGRLSRVEPIPVLPFVVQERSPELLSLDDLAARVRAAYPGRRIAEVRFTERGLSGVLFQLHADGDLLNLGDTIVWMHPASGERLAERSARTRSAGEGLMHWLLPLHVGSAFGTPGLWLMAAAGVAPLLLVTTGLVVWWRKQRHERRRRGRPRPP